MAKLGIMPIAFYRPGSPIGPFTDPMTVTTYSANTGMLDMSIGSDATLRGTYRSSDDTLISVLLQLRTATPSPLVIARINRVLDGLGAPNLESYYRAQGALVWRFPGNAATLNSGALAIEGNLTSSGWKWYIAASAPVAAMSAPVAPAAPAISPTLAPAAPPAAPVIAPTATPPAIVFKPSKADADRKGLFVYPSKATTNTIVITDENKRKIDAAWAKHIGGNQTTIALVGPAGTGKTSILDDLAAQHEVGIFTFDAMGASSFSDWTGRVDLSTVDGHMVTRFVYSSFIEAIRLDGDYAGQVRFVRIDEVNRAESASALNALMPILAQGSLYIPETGDTIKVDPKVLFAFTLNRGSMFGATVTLDEALADRMQGWVRLEYLPLEDEVKLVIDRVGLTDEQTRPLVMAARQVRDIAARGDISAGISHRRVLDAARFIKYGLTPAEAAEFCWANKYPDEGDGESDRGAVVIAINSVFKPAATPGA